jgi:DNA-binding protein
MSKKDLSTVFIGKKELLNYVLATVMNLNSDLAEVTIKARGAAISMAVDVAEIVRRRYVRNAVIEEVKIGTELLDSHRGGKSNVSFIEIHLLRPPGEISTPAPAPVKEPPKEHHPSK